MKGVPMTRSTCGPCMDFIGTKQQLLKVLRFMGRRDDPSPRQMDVILKAKGRFDEARRNPCTCGNRHRYQ
jgi:hypothetical protein